MALSEWFKGRNPQAFHAAAQRHANATWVLLIIAGIVWYVAGWKWALIPAALGAFTIVQSVSATSIASKLATLYEKRGRKPLEEGLGQRLKKVRIPAQAATTLRRT
jgi:hypothetical protein